MSSAKKFVICAQCQQQLPEDDHAKIIKHFINNHSLSEELSSEMKVDCIIYDRESEEKTVRAIMHCENPH